MNVGDYVRTKDGEIGKIIGYIDEPIEVGDYVNGERVIISDKRIYTIEDNDYSESEIKTIVTKEQFENMEYEVK